ncbi:protein NYNRIN-like [Lissotriton helveticus]
MTKPRQDLTDIALPNPDLTLYVDGSCMRTSTGELVAAYAVTTETEVIETHRIDTLSAQAAELVALTQACIRAKNLKVNIYTDSRYAFGVVHDFGVLWQERGFMTSHGTKIQHGLLIQALLDAIHLPTAIAIMKCKAHTKVTDIISQGNDLADRTAKLTAQTPDIPVNKTQTSIPEQTTCMTVKDPTQDVIDIQLHATPEEIKKWSEQGGVQTDQGWVTKGKATWFLPDSMVQVIINTAHSPAHLGEKAMLDSIQNLWFNKHLRAAAKQKVRTCMICCQFNPGKSVPVEQGGFQPPDHPFEVLQMDYIQMERCRGFKYVLVVVCALSRWTEAYPVPDYTAATTAKQLVREFFPRYGLPRVVYSDNGQPFSSELMKHVSLLLGYQWKFHCVRHPEAAGLVRDIIRP